MASGPGARRPKATGRSRRERRRRRRRRGRRRRRKKAGLLERGVWSMVMETSPFPVLPPRKEVVSRIKKSTGGRGKETKRDELKWRQTEASACYGTRRMRRRRTRQVALNWKRPKLEFSCQTWTSCPRGLFRSRLPLVPDANLPPPVCSMLVHIETDKFVDVYTEITRAISAGERNGMPMQEASRSTVANSIISPNESLSSLGSVAHEQCR